MGQRRSFRTFLITFTLIFMLGMSIEVFSQVINSLRATNTSQLVVDNNTNGLADGGDIIQYTVQIANCSPAGIGGVNYQSDIDPNTVLIPSSITVTTQNTTLCGGGGDTPPPAPTAVPPPTIPIVTTTTPANGATEVALNSNVDITFSEAVTVAGNWVQMICTTSGTFDITSANLTVSGGPITYTLDPNVDLVVGETCAVTVFAAQVTDSEGINPTSDYAFGFVTETPPTITTTTPANGAVAVPTTDDIVITFDEPVNVTAASFTLECPATVTFAGGFAVSGSGTSIITINPTGNLPAGTICEVDVIAANTSDLDANDPPDLLDGNGDLTEGDDYTFSFTTDVDAAPTVTNIVPATGAVNVSNTANITITFSELVFINGAGDFNLECPVGSPQGYTVTIPAVLPNDTLTVEIDPSSPLPDGQICTVTVFTSVTDSDLNDPPNNMVAPFVSTFTVEAPPAVTTTTPADLATGVSTSANIVVNFDEPVTASETAFTLVCNAVNIPLLAGEVTGTGTTAITINPTANLPANANCVVTVVALNVADVDPIDPPDNMVADYVFSFDTVADTAPIASSPLDGVTGVATASNIVINFNEPVDVTAGAFTVACPVGNPVAFTIIPALPTTNQTSITLDPSVNLPATTTCTVTVLQANVTDTDTDEPPDNMVADYVFTFDTIVDLAPTVNQAGIVPASTSTGANSASLNSVVSTSPTITIPFSESVDLLAGAFTLNCGAPVAIAVVPALPTSGTSFDISPTAPLTEGANCTLTVVAAMVSDTDVDDPPNLMVTDFTVTFAVDTAPTITSTTPVDTAINVPLGTNITLNFSEAVNFSGALSTLDCGAGAIAYTIAGSGTATITLDPTPATLPINSLCTVTIVNTDVTDVDAGDPPDNMLATVVFSFTTVNDNPPSVVSAAVEVGGIFNPLPLGGGIFADTDTDLLITFSEAVTVTGNWAELDCTISGIQDVSGGLAVTDADPVYTLNPATNLTIGESCTVTIFAIQVDDDDAIDPPTNMVVDAVFTFAVQDTPPQVLLPPTPINGATVGNTATVTFNFTENVNIAPSGITWTCNAVPVTFTPALPQNNVNTITLTPTVALSNNVACTVTLESTLITDVDVVDGANELDGSGNGDVTNGDADDFVLNFTIDTPPQVLNANVEVGNIPVLIPLGGAQRADVDTNIVINFTETINATINGVTLDCGFGAVPFAGVPMAGTSVLTINPTANLPGDALCTVVIVSTDVTDNDAFDPPNQLDGDSNFTEGPNFTFTFQTQTVANDDAYTVTPHLTFNSPVSVRNNDEPANTIAITGFGDTIGNANANATGTAVAITGGTVVLNPDGTFAFYPIAGFSNTSTSFFYTITGGDTAQVTLTVENEEFIWFVDNTPTAPTAPFTCSAPYTGTQACPSATLATATALDTANDIIFIASGSYTCNETLENSEWVIGDGATSTLAALVASRVTPVAGSDFAPYNTFSGTDPVLTSTNNCFTLTSNNDVRGLRIDNTTGYALTSAVNIGTSSVTEMSITGSGGLFRLTGGGIFDASFETLTSTGHTDITIDLNNITGTISNSVASSIDHNDTALTVSVVGGSPQFTYTGTITKTAGGYIVAVANTTGNTITFTGAITQNVAAGAGINISNVIGNVTFNTLNLGSLATRINTTVITIFNNTGTINLGTVSAFSNNFSTLTATNNDGTINSTTGVIDATNAPAITIDGPVGLTTLGMALTRVSSTNAANGIVIQDTNGSFTVNGTGAAGTGGTISNTTTHGADLINTTNITLRYMNFTNATTVDAVPVSGALSTGNNLPENAPINISNSSNIVLDNLNINGSVEQGINGHTVTNFTLSNSTLLNLGNGPDEDGLHFFNMLGTNNITNTTITSSGDDNVNIQMGSGTSTITVTGGSFNTGVLGSGVLFGIRGASNATITVSGATINNNFSGGIVADNFDTATMSITANNNTITNNNDGIQVSDNNGNADFNIDTNTFSGQDTLAITILKAAFSTGGTLRGFINNNNITIADNIPGDGIFIFQAGAGTLTTAITNNTINYRGTQRAIAIQAGQDGAGVVNATVTGNIIDMQLDGVNNGTNAIFAQVAITSPTGDGASMCFDAGGVGALRNTVTHSLGGVLAGGDIRVRQRLNGIARLPGYGGLATDTVAVAAYLDGRNTIVSPSTASVNVTGFAGGGACPQP